MTTFLTLHAPQNTPLRILVLMATTHEYGDELKKIGVKPVIIGVGPILAAMNTTAILKDLQHQKALPDLILNLGSAGSDKFPQKTILQASGFGYRDMDASLFGFPKGQTPFSPLPVFLPIHAQIPGIPSASMSTGAKVISAGEYHTFPEDAAEMEGYAIYTACLNFNIPMIKLAGISDGQQALTGKQEEWTHCLPEIDAHLAQIIENVKTGLKNGNLNRDHLLEIPEDLRQTGTTQPK